MVEAGDVDWANHSNNIDNSIGAVLSGDSAFKSVTGWIEANGGWDDTVVLVTADHGMVDVPDDRRLDIEGIQALREVLQEVALAGLVRRGFFGKAAFYGGTCLRIFQQLPRFSKDLDFSLLQPDPDFALQPSLRGLAEEFAALGIQVEIREK